MSEEKIKEPADDGITLSVQDGWVMKITSKSDLFTLDDLTHWMPLPKPPIGESNHE